MIFHLVHSPNSNRLGAVQCNFAATSCTGRVVLCLLKSTGNQFNPYLSRYTSQFLKTSTSVLGASAILAVRAPLESEMQDPKKPRYFLATFFSPHYPVHHKKSEGANAHYFDTVF